MFGNKAVAANEVQASNDPSEMVRFMGYFGEKANSKRILIKASGKRANNLQGDVSQTLINEEYSLAPTAA